MRFYRKSDDNSVKNTQKSTPPIDEIDGAHARFCIVVYMLYVRKRERHV